MKEKIIEALKGVIDPEIGFNVVDLGLIYDVEVSEDGTAKIQMTLSTPSCPLSGTIMDWVKSAAESVDGVKKAEIELVWNPPWSIEMASDEVKKSLGMV